MISCCQKSKKDYARKNINRIINENILPESQVGKTRDSNYHNINTLLVTYESVFQKETTPTIIQFHNPPQYAMKRHIKASYNIENADYFPIIDNKK